MKHTLFISDLHLEQTQPQITRAFLAFLNNEAKQADALYILGDFFEFWIGDDDRNDFHTQIINAVKAFTDTGIPTYFMAGNRDFLIGKRFLKATGMQALQDPSLLTLYGQSILLSHGDCLCTLDLKHQAFRKKYTNKLNQKMFVGLLPLRVRRRVAQNIRQHSRAHHQTINNDIMDVTPEEVVKLMTKYQVQQFIHGHTHRPNIHSLTINNQAAKRIVLGSWHNNASILRYDNDGKFELLDIPFIL